MAESPLTDDAGKVGTVKSQLFPQTPGGIRCFDTMVVGVKLNVYAVNS